MFSIQPIAVIAARNCEESIPNVLRQVRKAGIAACIVVANGCSDATVTVAEECGKALGLSTDVVDFAEPLGYDVPRAIGAYAALRNTNLWSGLIFLDGDWLGTFGRNLADFLSDVERQGLDVALPKENGTAGRISESFMFDKRHTRLDLDIWHRALSDYPGLQEVSPARLPMWVSREVFRLISPRLLYHPGRWLAQCVLRSADLELGCLPCDVRWLGNGVGTRDHQRLLQETFIGDALEGTAILQGETPNRVWHGRPYIGYHDTRNLRVLDEWSSTLCVYHSDDP